MKAQVDSWRVSTDLKTDLEREARRRKLSLSSVLDLAAREWLNNTRAGKDGEEEQRRLHLAASKFLGAFAGGFKSGDPRRTENVRRAVLQRLSGQLRLALVTSQAVLTELFHLVGDRRKEMEATWQFVRSGTLLLRPIEHTELPEIHALMSRYWDRPMDFADATLVHLDFEALRFDA